MPKLFGATYYITYNSKFLDLNVLCSEHQIKNDNICITCNKDICSKCKESIEHRNHKTQTINEFLKIEDNYISSNIKKVLDANIKKEKKQIEVINDMILKKFNKVTQIKNIENKINQRLLNNINIFPNNYNSIGIADLFISDSSDYTISVFCSVVECEVGE